MIARHVIADRIVYVILVETINLSYTNDYRIAQAHGLTTLHAVVLL